MPLRFDSSLPIATGHEHIYVLNRLTSIGVTQRHTTAWLNQIHRVIAPVHIVRVHRIVSWGIRGISQISLLKTFVLSCIT